MKNEPKELAMPGTGNQAIRNLFINEQVIVGADTSQTRPVDGGLYVVEILPPMKGAPSVYVVQWICYHIRDGKGVLACRTDKRFHDVLKGRRRWVFVTMEEAMKRIVGKVVYALYSFDSSLKFIEENGQIKQKRGWGLW